MKIGDLLRRQIRTNVTKKPAEAPNGLGVTNVIASGVEFFGVIVVLMILGWILSQVTGSVAVFVGLTIFGVFSTLVKTYYQSKAQLDRLGGSVIQPLVRTDGAERAGLGGFLEADLSIPEGDEFELCVPDGSANLEAAQVEDKEDSERP